MSKGNSHTLPLAAKLGLFLAFMFSILMLAKSQQHETQQIWSSGLTAFIAYALMIYKKLSFRWVVALGLIARVVMIFIFPGLSDDIYRFLWDGHLTTGGYNPYSHLPSDIVEQGVSGIDRELFEELNSPNYYTIYPPLTQFVFYLAASIGGSVVIGGIVIKVIFLVAELATLVGLVKLLKHLQKPNYLLSIYWLSPLIIVEGMGNLHFEILMVTFLAWGFYWLFVKNNLTYSAVLWSLGVAAKLLPVIFLPYLFFRMNGQQKVRFFSVFTVACILIFLPIFLGVQIANFGSSVDLYFQKFEFNASIYYMLRWVGKVLSGYNLIYYIGPLLGLATVGLILKRSLRSRTYTLQSFLEFALFAFCTYLLLATTVHPWYLAVPVMLSVFSSYRFALLWSGLAMLTYANYGDPSAYQEHLGVVAFEYVLVFGFLIYEYFRRIQPSSRLR